MPVFLTEIKDWYNNYKFKTLFPLFILMTITAILFLGRPEFCLVVFIIYLLVIGNISGRESWNDVILAEWVLRINLNANTAIIGKLLGSAFIVLIHIFLLLPLWIYMSVMWGIEWLNLAILFVHFLSAHVFAVSLTILGNFLSIDRYNKYFKDREALIGRFLMVFWLLICFIPSLKIFGPFSQIFLTAYKINIISSIINFMLYNLVILLIIFLTAYQIRKSSDLLNYFLDISRKKGSGNEQHNVI